MTVGMNRVPIEHDLAPLARAESELMEVLGLKPKLIDDLQRTA